MANPESKSIKTHPELEQEMIERHELFGWKLKSSQEIYSQTSHEEDGLVYTYNCLTTTNYVKLVFSRDRDRENMDKIKKLEEEYWNCVYTYYETPGFLPKKKIFWAIAGIFLIPAVLLLLINGTQELGAVISGFILGLAPFILRHFLYYAPKKKEGDKCLQRSFDIEKEIEAMNE